MKYLDCTGCGLCSVICEHNAITMDFDEQGFRRPVLNDRCLSCGVCDYVCSKVDKLEFNTTIHKSVCRIIDQEKYRNSSSGGIFIALAEYVLSQGGYVCGAVFDDRWNVTHICSNDMEDVRRMQKSKYVQSDIRHIFSRVDSLVDDHLVMFTGTPCQCAAIKTYLEFRNRNLDNLLLCDFKCYGVFSPKNWREYLDSIGDVWKVDFRPKLGMMRKQKMLVNDVLTTKKDEGSFYDMFSNKVMIRDICKDCPYRKDERVSDITLSDCWEINKEYPYLLNFTDLDNKSSVYMNTSKGAEFFDRIKSNLLIFVYE